MKRIGEVEKEADTTDGIKLWSDDGWLLIRPSGTEPVIRIFAEHTTSDGASRLADYGLELVERFNRD